MTGTAGNGTGQPPQHVPVQPSPVTFLFGKIPTPDGQEVFALELHGVNGMFVAFFDRPSLVDLADQASKLATGLTIVRDPLPPDGPA